MIINNKIITDLVNEIIELIRANNFNLYMFMFKPVLNEHNQQYIINTSYWQYKFIFDYYCNCDCGYLLSIHKTKLIELNQLFKNTLGYNLMGFRDRIFELFDININF